MPHPPGSLRQTAIMDGEEVYRAFAEILHTVRTGRPAFDKVFGQPFYEYLAAERPRVEPYHSVERRVAGRWAADLFVRS